jgi:hypothetical protein
MVAFQHALATWANWVDQNVDPAKTRVFFQSMSPTHYRYPVSAADLISYHLVSPVSP